MGKFYRCEAPIWQGWAALAGRERKNCSSTTSKGCSHQVLCRLKPGSGVAPPMQIWPRAPPRSCKHSAETQVLPEHPKGNDESTQKSRPRSKRAPCLPQNLHEAHGLPSNPSSLRVRAAPVADVPTNAEFAPSGAATSPAATEEHHSPAPRGSAGSYKSLTPAIRRLGSHRKSSPRFQQPSSPGKRQAVASHGAPIAPGTTLPCWQAHMEEKEASCIT